MLLLMFQGLVQIQVLKSSKLVYFCLIVLEKPLGPRLADSRQRWRISSEPQQ